MKSLTENDNKVALHIAILTIHDTRTQENDSSGRYLAQAVADSGHKVAGQAICPDNRYAIRKHLSDWILNEDIHAIITNGGTGMRDRNATLAAVAPCSIRKSPGLASCSAPIHLPRLARPACNRTPWAARPTTP